MLSYCHEKYNGKNDIIVVIFVLETENFEKSGQKRGRNYNKKKWAFLKYILIDNFGLEGCLFFYFFPMTTVDNTN